MEKEPVISHIALMLKYLDEASIRAVYMVVKELYTLQEKITMKKR